MKVEIKEIDPVLREMTITASVEETEPIYRRALNKIKGKASVPGFRPGKAPEKMVENQYQSYILQEFYEIALEKFYFQAIDENNINPVNEPENTNIDWDRGKEFVATYRFEVHPEIELKQYSNFEVEFEPTPLDVEIDQYLEEMRQKMAQFLEAEGPVQVRDLVDVEVTYEENSEEKKMNHSFFLFNEYMDDDLIATLVGKNIGESVATEMDEHVLHHEEHDHSNEHVHKKVPVTIIINSIRRSHLPELDDEFAKDAEFDSLADMREKIGEEMREHNEKGNEDRKRDAIMTKLYELNPFPVPKSFVDRITNMYLEPQKGKDIPDWFKTYYGILADKQAKRLYILRKLKEIYQIEVTKEDQEAFIAKMAAEHKESVDDFKKNHPDHVDPEELDNDIIEEKIFTELEKSITYIKPVPKTPEQEEEKQEKPKAKPKAKAKEE
ncbi:MAG TPA: trigger factor [Candidatus Cloacimonadota bacterium]|nr:trigger factor [Candidatus Cloacimonadota bacterium]HPT71490.1 trigger factor [Candidatus Cloacimonadota bacterium]